MDLAIDAGLAHPPGDELRHLGAEVDDEDEVMLHASRLAESVAEAQPGSSQARALLATAG